MTIPRINPRYQNNICGAKQTAGPLSAFALRGVGGQRINAQGRPGPGPRAIQKPHCIQFQSGPIDMLGEMKAWRPDTRSAEGRLVETSRPRFLASDAESDDRPQRMINVNSFDKPRLQGI